MTAPSKVARVYPPIGRYPDALYNRDHPDLVTAAGGLPLLPADLVWCKDIGRLVLQYVPIAGSPHYYGPVADAAALLTIHAPDLPIPRYVLPGDTARVGSATGPLWQCITGNGLLATDWAEVSGDYQAAGDYQPLSAELTALASGASTAYGRSLLALPDVAALRAEAVPIPAEPSLGNPGTSGYVLSSTAAGVRSWVPPQLGGAGTGGIRDGLLHWVTGRAADNAAVDLHSGDSWTWTGTPATAPGKVATALSFAGTSWIARTLTGSRILRDGFTRACWVRPSELPTGGVFLSSIGAFGVGHTSYQFAHGGVVKATLSTDGAGDATGWTNLSDVLTTSAWVFVVQIYDPLGLSYSYNFGGPASLMRSTPIEVYHAINPTLYLGAGNASDTRRWMGLIDFWAIWGRVLTIPEICQLYNNGSGCTYESL